VTITSRPLEKIALRRGPSPVPVRKGGPAYGRSEKVQGERRMSHRRSVASPIEQSGSPPLTTPPRLTRHPGTSDVQKKMTGVNHVAVNVHAVRPITMARRRRKSSPPRGLVKMSAMLTDVWTLVSLMAPAVSAWRSMS